MVMVALTLSQLSIWPPHLLFQLTPLARGGVASRSYSKGRRNRYPRPRAEVIELVGEANQALPVLVLRAGEASTHASGEADGRQFVVGAERILDARSLIPPPHP
ncbi:MAG: DUF3088 family protein [Mesorhizobium sp.]|nr:MAG: DUF3088 family protein [Mesorhizobium sp.]RWL95426.1 MAG: DUF3088 family protein [Mesorhizobium sp.]